MKVLIVRLSSFGDVVHTFPALTDLAAARPELELDWLVEDSFASLAGLHPAVQGVIGLASGASAGRRTAGRSCRNARRFAGLRCGATILLSTFRSGKRRALVARLASRRLPATTQHP
jgi:ADP-heptose:LPS heptosyltransferase